MANGKGILDRYKQIKPKFVFFETEVVYAGKTVNLLPNAKEVARELRSLGLQKLILLPSTKTGKDVPTSQVPNRYFHVYCVGSQYLRAHHPAVPLFQLSWLQAMGVLLCLNNSLSIILSSFFTLLEQVALRSALSIPQG